MFSGDSHTKQPQRQKPADPFSDLFKSPRSRGQIVKEDPLDLGCDRDALLFSKIDPFDLSFARKQTQQASKTFEDHKKVYPTKEAENEDILFRLTNKNKKKNPQEDLHSLLCIDSKPIEPLNKKKGPQIQNFLIETPKSPSDIKHSKKENKSYRDRPLNTSPKASKEEFELLIDNYVRAEKPLTPNNIKVRRIADPLGMPFDLGHEQERVNQPGKMYKYDIRPPGVDFRIHARAIPPTPLFRRINPYVARRPICGISPKQGGIFPLPLTGVFPHQLMYAKARSIYPIGDYTRHPIADRKIFRRGVPGQLSATVASHRQMVAVMQKRKSLKIRIKMFLLSKMSDEQQTSIDKMVLTDESIKFKFFRTVEEVAGILGLPRLSFRDVNELRILFNLFSRYGGYMNSNSSFLTSIKRSISKYHFKYLSYVIPLELSGYYYKPSLKTQKRTRGSFCPTKEDLSTVVCIGIYDDIFYFLEQLEAGDIPGGIIAELLNLFFLVSDILFKKFDRHLLHAEKLVYRLIAKPYRIVLERMPREILYQLQEAVFNIILKFEENKRVEQCLNGDTLSSILEAMLHRKVLKTFPEIAALDDGGYSEEVLVVKLINATNTSFQPTKKIVSLVLGIGDADPGLLLRTSSKILFDKQTLHSIFLKYRGFIISQTKKHIATLESRVLLNDRKELEVIVTKFLPFAFKSEISVNGLLKTLQEYKSHLLEKRVYFFKRKSSNINLMIEHLSRSDR